MILLGFIIKLSGHKLDFQANAWGKIKLNLQVFGVGFVFLGLIFSNLDLLHIGQGILWGSIFFSVMSLVNKGA